MSDKTEAKVNESKESGNKKSPKKIDEKNGAANSSGGNNPKDDKIYGTGSSTTTTTGTATTAKSSPSTQTTTGTATTAANVTTSAATTTAKAQADTDHKDSGQVQKSNFINSMPKYNNLAEGPLSVPSITSNYFCFDCGAIMTTIEDKEQHLKIESERKNNAELTAEE